MTPCLTRVFGSVVNNEAPVTLKSLAGSEALCSRVTYQLNKIRRPSKSPSRPTGDVWENIFASQIPRREIIRYSHLDVDLPITWNHIFVGCKCVIQAIKFNKGRIGSIGGNI